MAGRTRRRATIEECRNIDVSAWDYCNVSVVARQIRSAAP
jgi:hypothetical protein